MIQPKHSPTEALERIKLMMKYDSSKTLTENKVVITEQISCPNSITYDTAMPHVREAAEILEYMSTIFFRVYNKEDRSKNLLEKTKYFVGKSIYDKLENTCESGLTWYKQKIKELTKGPYHKYGLDIEKELRQFIKDLGSENPEATRYINQILKILESHESTVISPTPDDSRREEASDNSSNANDVASWWTNKFPCLQQTNSFVSPIKEFVENNKKCVEVNFKVKGEIKKYLLDMDGLIFKKDTSGNLKYFNKKVQCTSDNKVTLVAESKKKTRILEQANLDDLEPEPPDINPEESDTTGNSGTSGNQQGVSTRREKYTQPTKKNGYIYVPSYGSDPWDYRYNLQTQRWETQELPRTSWIDVNPTTKPSHEVANKSIRAKYDSLINSLITSTNNQTQTTSNEIEPEINYTDPNDN